MVIQPSEYRKKYGGIKEISLKSGDMWKIRKMPFEALAEFFSILGISIDKKNDQSKLNALFSEKTASPDFIKKIVELAKILLPSCCVAPEVILAGTPTDQQLLFIEIEFNDIFELFFAVMDYSGFSSKEIESRESFQPEHNGKDTETSGSGNPSTP
jgi:hypothetical protein